MKNLILVFLISLVSLSTYANDTTTTSISEAERIFDKYSGKIVDGFNSVVEGVTPVAIEGFEIVVKLQIAKGIAFLLIVIFGFYLMRIQRLEYKRILDLLTPDNVPDHMNGNYGPYNDYNSTIKLWISTALGIISLVATPFLLFNGIIHLIAPEWFAIKEIFNLVNGQ